jgi:hypothetical protein
MIVQALHLDAAREGVDVSTPAKALAYGSLRLERMRAQWNDEVSKLKRQNAGKRSR